MLKSLRDSLGEYAYLVEANDRADIYSEVKTRKFIRTQFEQAEQGSDLSAMMGHVTKRRFSLCKNLVSTNECV